MRNIELDDFRECNRIRNRELGAPIGEIEDQAIAVGAPIVDIDTPLQKLLWHARSEFVHGGFSTSALVAMPTIVVADYRIVHPLLVRSLPWPSRPARVVVISAPCQDP